MKTISTSTKVILSIILIVVLSVVIFLLPMYDFRLPSKDSLHFGRITTTAAYTYQFNSPTDIQSPSDGPEMIAVVEQAGKILVITDIYNREAAPSVMLDITNVVESGGEKGLLGLAFHPNFSQNGFIFVDYTKANPLRTVISRFVVEDGVADPASELILLEVEQPYDNHNAGQIAFGPDGYLYITFGDGGSANDPHGNGQDLTTYLGTILRIDVDKTSNNLPYSIPVDNPFVGNNNGWKEEIFAYGFRNPWRMSFGPTGEIYVADVGQNSWEEVDVVYSGKNYGWNVKEGNHCFARDPCSGDYVDPIFEYNHSLGISITGGYVYQAGIEPLSGYYVFADFGSGRFWGLMYDTQNGVSDLGVILLDANMSPSTFGIRHSDNELLFADYFSGQIYLFVEY